VGVEIHGFPLTKLMAVNTGLARLRRLRCVSVCVSGHMGWVKIGHFRRKTRYNSKTVEDRRIVSNKVE